MTREEQILQEAEKQAKGLYLDKHNLIQMFKYGAHWADQHPNCISVSDKPEFELNRKMVSLDEVCEWIMRNNFLYTKIEYLPASDYPQAYIDTDKMIRDIRKKFCE